MSDLRILIEDLVAANHILYRHGIVDGYGHASFRHPTNPDCFLMAAAISPGRVREGDIIELDLDGRQVGEEGRPVYSERFIHAEIYRARAEVNAVVHSHSPAVIPFGVTDVPLRPIVHTASFLQAGVPVFNTHHVPEAKSPLVNTPGLGKALVAALAQNTVVLMRGHGTPLSGPISAKPFRARFIPKSMHASSCKRSRLGRWITSTPMKRKRWHGRSILARDRVTVSTVPGRCGSTTFNHAGLKRPRRWIRTEDVGWDRVV